MKELTAGAWNFYPSLMVHKTYRNEIISNEYLKQSAKTISLTKQEARKRLHKILLEQNLLNYRFFSILDAQQLFSFYCPKPLYTDHTSTLITEIQIAFSKFFAANKISLVSTKAVVIRNIRLEAVVLYTLII